VSALASRKLYLTASALILGAIAAQLLAKHHAGRGMMAMARAAGMPAERSRLREAAAWHVHRSGLWELVGFGFAALAVGSWVASRKRREPGPQGVPLILLCLYVSLLLLIV
jgi:hypothetical protein